MKIKLQYIIIAILVVTNIYFIIDGKTKSYGSDNSEFKREMNYLEKRIKFDENQLELAKKEYERYSSNKRKIERRTVMPTTLNQSVLDRKNQILYMYVYTVFCIYNMEE